MSENKNDVKPVENKNSMKELFDAIVVAFVIAMIIRTFFLGVYKIPTGSMENTLLVGDHLLVNKLSYLFSKPKHDDIVVFEYPVEPSKDYIKRIIGIPGDEIEIKDKIVYRNGEKLTPPYTIYSDTTGPRDTMEKFTVPEGMYFAMGDNRDNSFDSRFWGFVPEDKIVGKAFILYFSWGDDGVRFNRIFNLIK